MLTSGLGDDVGAELHDDAAEGSAVGSDIEENLGVAVKLMRIEFVKSP